MGSTLWNNWYLKVFPQHLLEELLDQLLQQAVSVLSYCDCKSEKEML